MNKTNNEPFIRPDQFNFIRAQVRNLVSAHASVKDQDVLKALKYGSLEKSLNLFSAIDKKVEPLLDEMVEIEKATEAERFLDELNAYVIPFRNISEKTVQKLFPKAKKLKMPSHEEFNFKELSYLGWYDIRSNRKYLIVEVDGKLKGIQGTFQDSNRKSICTLCGGYEEVGLFMCKVKSGKETYLSRGNYICKDSQICNHNMTTRTKLNDFVSLLNQN
ncbi:FusB/FusC family EF-G-binding protein [Alkalihalobacillus sp. TS-13]|uniref:FusB/FusC family EF-G-binding protein n=1 Tax=Alkalihalobacillus sp. TS-13 TaxID=2842455 RepID=UPI001C88BA51|nr:FusB/FusC family EF-G-binding protein [Alkalihalobacillus sp. TS-13]